MLWELEGQEVRWAGSCGIAVGNLGYPYRILVICTAPPSSPPYTLVYTLADTDFAV